MARVEYGGIVTALRGSIGGLTFQQNKSGGIVRVRPVQKRYVNPLQSARIAEFQKVVGIWSTMTVSEKEAWGTFASSHTYIDYWGEEKELSGYNWFLSANSNLVLVEETPNIAPPSWTTPLAVPEFDVVLTSTHMYVTWSPEFLHENEHMIVYTSSITNRTSTSDRSALRMTNIAPVGGSTAWNFQNEWPSVHGISMPIPGGTSTLAVIVAIATIRSGSGISSAFTKAIGYYNP